MRLSIRAWSRVSKHAIGLLDTSVVIDLDLFESDDLPDEIAIAAITFAELAAGPHAARDPMVRARRQEKLQQLEAAFTAVPFDARAARAYGQISAAIYAFGRKSRGSRAADLFIAATALANRLPLYTRNPAGFEGLSDLIEIVAL
jgi:predicted nucleic acid-binding protein